MGSSLDYNKSSLPHDNSKSICKISNVKTYEQIIGIRLLDDIVKYFPIEKNNYFIGIDPWKLTTKPNMPTEIDIQDNLEIQSRGSLSEIIYQKEQILYGSQKQAVLKDDLKTFPFSAIVYLEINFPGRIHRGTGSFIGPHHILTSKKNVYDPKMKRWSKCINIFSGKFGEYNLFGYELGIRIYTHEPGEVENYDIGNENDLAIIVMKKSLGFQTGWFGLYSTSDIYLKKRYSKINIAGFPLHDLEKKEIKIMHSQKGKLLAIKSGNLIYDLDSKEGDTGSPLWIKSSSCEYYVVGVHIGVEDKDGETNSKGCKLSRRKFAWATKIIRETWYVGKELHHFK